MNSSEPFKFLNAVPINMIKLIAFDLWKTLVHKEASTKKMLEKTGSNIPHEKFVKIFEESVETEMWKSEYEAYKNLCGRMDVELTDYNIDLLRKIRSEAEDNLKIYDHSVPMVKKLRGMGYKIGVISNSSVFGIEKVRKKTDLLNYVDYPLFSYEIGLIKPDLRIFQELLRRADCKPQEAVMVGDNPTDDVIPARSIGMNAILFKSYAQLKNDFGSLSIYLK